MNDDRASSPTSPTTPASRCRATSTGPASIPIATGPLPRALRGVRPPGRRHPGADRPGRALDEDRDAIYHAVLCDPQVQARLTLDEAWRMTDELIAAEARWLPAWLGGAA